MSSRGKKSTKLVLIVPKNSFVTRCRSSSSGVDFGQRISEHNSIHDRTRESVVMRVPSTRSIEIVGQELSALDFLPFTVGLQKGAVKKIVHCPSTFGPRTRSAQDIALVIADQTHRYRQDGTFVCNAPTLRDDLLDNTVGIQNHPRLRTHRHGRHFSILCKIRELPKS